METVRQQRYFSSFICMTTIQILWRLNKRLLNVNSSINHLWCHELWKTVRLTSVEVWSLFFGEIEAAISHISTCRQGEARSILKVLYEKRLSVVLKSDILKLEKNNSDSLHRSWRYKMKITHQRFCGNSPATDHTRRYFSSFICMTTIQILWRLNKRLLNSSVNHLWCHELWKTLETVRLTSFQKPQFA